MVVEKVYKELEYQAASDNRAATLANLQQQGFQNAAARRQQDLANQMGISNLQSGLGARAQDFVEHRYLV